jgi:PAS domain S-box-containing protein
MDPTPRASRDDKDTDVLNESSLDATGDLATGDLAQHAFRHGIAPAAIVGGEGAGERIVEANGSFARLAGRGATELRGVALSEVVGLGADASATLARAVHEPVRCEAGDLVLELRAAPLPAQLRFVIELRDITSTEDEATRLRAAVRRLEDIVDNSAALIYVKDPAGRYTLVNHHFIRRFGFRREDVIGRTDHELFPDASADAYAANDRRVLVSGEAVEVEEPAAEVVDGRWLSIKFPLLDHEGRPYALAGISTDITDRKRAEAAAREARDEAERANRAKSEFLSRMSHELRTPLNAILGFGQLLALEELAPEGRTSVERILKAGDHLLALINEVLEITRIEAGAQPIAVEPVHACEPLVEALELVRPLGLERGIELAGDMHAGLHRYVLADFQRLKQVLLNLLTNAIKYNRDQGVVRTYFAQTPEGALRILVVDTGHGMDAEGAARVFRPFERLDADRTETEGTGLGLALSKSLVEAMGGRIGIEHTAPGEGSTFYVELPLTEPPDVAAEQRDRVPVAPEAWDLGSVKVLYVEDNLSNFELVQSILARAGDIELIPAIQGLLALELAAQHRPDVVLLDLDLPDIDGDVVLRRLKDDPRTSSIPVIILSADATPAQVTRLEQEGIVAYLTKPLRIGRFLDTLQLALRRR